VYKKLGLDKNAEEEKMKALEKIESDKSNNQIDTTVADEEDPSQAPGFKNTFMPVHATGKFTPPPPPPPSDAPLPPGPPPAETDDSVDMEYSPTTPSCSPASEPCPPGNACSEPLPPGEDQIKPPRAIKQEFLSEFHNDVRCVSPNSQAESGFGSSVFTPMKSEKVLDLYVQPSNTSSTVNGWEHQEKGNFGEDAMEVDEESSHAVDEEFVHEEDSDEESPMFEKFGEVSPPRPVILENSDEILRELKELALKKSAELETKQNVKIEIVNNDNLACSMIKKEDSKDDNFLLNDENPLRVETEDSGINQKSNSVNKNEQSDSPYPLEQKETSEQTNKEAEQGSSGVEADSAVQLTDEEEMEKSCNYELEAAQIYESQTLPSSPPFDEHCKFLEPIPSFDRKLSFYRKLPSYEID
jgi:hypothetical protein